MDPSEEQAQEIEVLQSIYPDELELISDTHFSILIKLDTPSDRKHALLLVVRYTPNYPEEIPNLEILKVEEEFEELDSDEESDTENQFVPISELTELERADLKILHVKLLEEAEMNLGFPSIFALAALLKDEAEALFVKKVDEAQKLYDRDLLAREAEEQKKFHGTKVTKESYAEWREKFRAEMEFEKKDKLRYEQIHGGKMTGREVFEKGLAGDEDELELAEGASKLTVA